MEPVPRAVTGSDEDSRYREEACLKNLSRVELERVVSDLTDVDTINGEREYRKVG